MLVIEWAAVVSHTIQMVQKLVLVLIRKSQSQTTAGILVKEFHVSSEPDVNSLSDANTVTHLLMGLIVAPNYSKRRVKTANQLGLALRELNNL